MAYYKYRENNCLESDEISDSFWNSYRMYMKRMADENWLTESFGHTDEYSSWNYSYNINEIHNRITEDLGIFIDFYSQTNIMKPSTNDILSLIEFFYKHISKPLDFVRSYNNEEFPSEFNSVAARYEYTIYINNLFKTRKHCYNIKNGQITKVVSRKLNSIYYPELGKAVDKELSKMIDTSFSYFTNRNDDMLDNALNIISNALERAKTLEGEKKESIEEILSRISGNEEIKQDISNLIKLTTKISNSYKIRHHEHNQIKINSVKYREFLYFNYLNIIRLLLSTYDIEI